MYSFHGYHLSQQTCPSTSKGYSSRFASRLQCPPTRHKANPWKLRESTCKIHVSHMGNYMSHVPVSGTKQTCTFWPLEGKQGTTMTFLEQHNYPVPFVSRTRHCILWRCCPPYRAHVCVVPKYCGLSSGTSRIFHSDTFPPIIQSLFLISENITVYRGSRLVIPGNAGYPG